MSCGGEDVYRATVIRRCDLALQSESGGGDLGTSGHWKAGENGKFGQVRGNPVDEREKLVAKEFNSSNVKQFPA